jgi:hypothetical protein
MDLPTWMKKKNLSILQASKRLGITYRLLRFYLLGKGNFGKKIAERVEAVTEGEVNRVEVIWPGYLEKILKTNDGKKDHSL